MSQHLRYAFITCLCLLSMASTRAQDLLGAASSNYSGLTGVEFNPANLADNRIKFELQLGGVGFGAGNNLMGFNPAYVVRDGSLIHGTYPKMDPLPPTLTSYLFPNFENDRSAFVAANAYLPGVMVNINDKNTISVTGRVRNYVNVDGVDKEFFQLVFNELNVPSLQNLNWTCDNLSIQTMSWAELALGYGRVIKDDGPHFLKVGGRIKALQGIQSAYLFVKDFKFEVTSDSTISLTSSAVNYGHSTNFEFNSNDIDIRPSSKFGLGLDLGVVYEWRPQHAKYRYDMDGEKNLWRKDLEKYVLKASLSVTDMGGLSFKKGNGSGDFTANIVDWNILNINPSDYPVDAIDDTLINRFKIPQANSYYRMNLPTAVITQLDWNIGKGFYLNQTNYFAFQFNDNPNKVHDFTTYALTPRWESRPVGIMVPITYHTLMGLRTGFALRLGPLTIGTSSAYPYTTFLRADGTGKKEITGADGYVMLRIPIGHKKVKDRDEDKVSDKRDNCIKNPGPWEFRGCPDRDGDHVMDDEDKCPDVAGVKALFGCPDQDGDGLTDLDDQCPTEAGSKELGGCPDRDKDGISDAKDDCPDQAGLIQFNGCPDTDSDGIMDKNDDCPEIRGLAQFSGCPDTDSDGVSDKTDECPEVKGLPALAGCPDSDGDGIADKVDECPNVYGVRELKGCPAYELVIVQGAARKERVKAAAGVFGFSVDIDIATGKFELKGNGADSVNTVFVTSPNLRGKNAYRESDGYFHFPKEAEAVVLKEEEKEVMKTAFDNLEFESARDVIKSTSYAALDQLGDLLQTYPTWKLRISGHTDNVGDRSSNRELSKKRAEAVKKYLMKRGVDPSKFEVLYFGQDQPIDTNDTEEGRAHNRRVELLIVE